MLIVMLSTASALELKPFVEAESWNLAGSVDIGSTLDVFEGGELEPGGTATFTHNLGAAGVIWRNVDVAAVVRYDYVTTYKPDTADVLFNIQNDLSFDDRTYSTELRLRRGLGMGLRAGYTWKPTPNVDVRIAGSVLRARELLDGSLQGDVTFTEGSLLPEGQLELDYRFDEDLIFERELKGPRGWGGTMDVGLNWRPNPRTQFRFQANDLVSALFYKNAPRTQAVLDASDSVLDENNVVISRPLFSGQNSQGGYRARYTARYQLAAEHALSARWHIYQDVQHFAQSFFSTTDIIYKPHAHFRIGPSVEWRTLAPGVVVQSKWGSVRLQSDALDWREARYLRVAFRIGAPRGPVPATPPLPSLGTW